MLHKDQFLHGSHVWKYTIDGQAITVEIGAHQMLDEILGYFSAYLRACGYRVDDIEEVIVPDFKKNRMSDSFEDSAD